MGRHAIFYKIRSLFRLFSMRHVELRDRNVLQVHEILSSYYDLSIFSKEILFRAWIKVAKELMANPGSLRPNDRLLIELAHPKCLLFEGDDERSFLLDVLKFECKRANEPFQPEKIETIDDCVQTLYRCFVKAV